jgi:cell division protein FtsW (lipid II flippase)
MTPRSLFLIFIKILGIYMVIASMTVVPQSISAISMFFSGADNSNDADYIIVSGLMLLTVGLYFLILYFCVFRTDLIIDKLRLDKNFTEEKFELNIHRSTVLTIVLTVVGILVLIEAIPNLCRNIFSFVQQKSVMFIKDPDSGWIIFYAVKALLGYILLTNSRMTVNFIERKRKNKITHTIHSIKN